MGFTAEQVLQLLDSYKDMNRDTLKANLKYFLSQVIPVAEQVGVKWQSILMTHRILYWVYRESYVLKTDAADLIDAVPSPSNGLCFCTGSYGLVQIMI